MLRKEKWKHIKSSVKTTEGGKEEEGNGEKKQGRWTEEGHGHGGLESGEVSDYFEQRSSEGTN